MEESARTVFKGKFIKTAILLNLFVLFLAGSIITFIFIPQEMAYRIPLVILLAIGAVILGVVTWKKYTATKKWLEIHGKEMLAEIEHRNKKNRRYRVKKEHDFDEEDELDFDEEDEGDFDEEDEGDFDEEDGGDFDEEDEGDSDEEDEGDSDEEDEGDSDEEDGGDFDEKKV